MKLPLRMPGRRALPMPLWLQGVFELAQSAVISGLLILVPLAAVWVAGGFADRTATAMLHLVGQAWLLIHGVPLEIAFSAADPDGTGVTGLLAVVPLGLTLIPFLLAWRAGRRLARASYSDQLWQALLGALGIYSVIGAGVAYLSTTAEVTVPLAGGALIPLVSAGLGLVIGAYREAGEWSRLIGVERAAWLAKTSQHSRWAGSYAWSGVRAGFVALTVSLGLSALLLAVTFGLRWAELAAVYQRLDAGIVGGGALTLAQLGFLPNLVVWTLAWASGTGFALGSGSAITPLTTSAGPLPALPVLGAVPPGTLEYGLAALAIPVLAGLLAGWWFFREGENHFDEWLEIKMEARWFTASISTLAAAVLIGVTAGVAAGVLAWVSRASLGLGRLVDLGPNPAWVALLIAAEVAVGAVIGYAAGPLLEREGRQNSG
ncbi:cell division protein PerM [Arthrobacter sp. Hz1]